MPAAILAQLIVALGPSALQLIPKLAAVWHKETLTLDEVTQLCAVAATTYEQYRADAKKAAGQA